MKQVQIRAIDNGFIVSATVAGDNVNGLPSMVIKELAFPTWSDVTDYLTEQSFIPAAQ